MLVATSSGSLLPWEQELTAFKSQLSAAFNRAELRRPASAFIDGLLSGVARKTGWQLAEQAGLERPYRLQSLLGRSSWQADRLRDMVRADVLATLGDAGGVLVVDETGFLKKGTHSVGVARQYSGTAGRVENCQVGVFVAYASRFGQTLIDRRLYLPEAWANDAARWQGAAVPESVAFQTKPAIAAEMIAAALDAGAACAFVLADALYGADSRDQTVAAESGNKGGGLPAAPGYRLDQSLIVRRPAVEPGHIRLAPSFVDKNQLTGRQAWLIVAPFLPGLGDVRTVLLGRSERLFLSVSLSVDRVFQMTPVLAVTFCMASSQVFSSSIVASGRATTCARSAS